MVRFSIEKKLIQKIMKRIFTFHYGQIFNKVWRDGKVEYK